jgi:hypothetical protein
MTKFYASKVHQGSRDGEQVWIGEVHRIGGNQVAEYWDKDIDSLMVRLASDMEYRDSVRASGRYDPDHGGEGHED